LENNLCVGGQKLSLMEKAVLMAIVDVAADDGYAFQL
jgi:hypothetical protein